MANGWQQGVISELNLVRQRGLIRTRAGKEVPFTKASLDGVELKQLRRGQWVSFQVQLGFDGAQAVGVRPCPSPGLNSAGEDWHP